MHVDSVSTQPSFVTRPIFPFGIEVKPIGSAHAVAQVSDVLHELTDEYGLVLMRGFAPMASAEEFAATFRSWGSYMEWPFGTVLELKQDDSATDVVFDNACIPLHWDAMFSPMSPRYVIFHCINPPGPDDGGRTEFCHTAKALERATEEQRLAWSSVVAKYSVEQHAHYGGSVTSPLVTKHPHTGRDVLRLSEPTPEGANLINPVKTEILGNSVARDTASFHDAVEAIRSPDVLYRHTWEPGDVLLTDNYTLLHGREAFHRRCQRYLRRIQVHDRPPRQNPGWRGEVASDR